MHASSGPDHDLLAEALRGPSPQEAARSLDYWRARCRRLPRRRRAARREARAMVAAWEARLRRAEIERFGGGPLGRLLAAGAVLRGERPGALIGRAVLALLPRRLVSGALVLVLTATVALGVALGLIFAQLL